MRRIFTALMLVGMATTLIGASEAAGTAAPPRSGPSPGLRHGTENYSYPTSLLNAHSLQAQGQADATGNCQFAPLAPLTHAQGSAPVTRRETAMDYDHCVMTYQVGTPSVASSDSEPSNGSSVVIPIAPGTGPTSGANGPERASYSRALSDAKRSQGTGSNYYTIIWEDILNIDLSHTSPHIQWASNSQCVWLTGSGTYAYWWWLSTDGWHLGASDWSTSTSRSGACTGSNGWYWTVHERASPYWNTFFCGYEVDVWVVNAWVTAAPAAISGGNDATWNTSSCAPLHWHDELH